MGIDERVRACRSLQIVLMSGKKHDQWGRGVGCVLNWLSSSGISPVMLRQERVAAMLVVAQCISQG